MVPDYERAVAVFPTFFFIVMFLVLSAVFYTRYRAEESDLRASRYFRDYIIIMNTQSSFISLINGLILIILFNQLALGIVMVLVTQSITAYVYIAHYMQSYYDSLFFLAFAVLAYVFELFYMFFAGHATLFFGREVWGLPMAVLSFIILVSALSAVIVLVAEYANRQGQGENNVQGLQ